MLNSLPNAVLRAARTWPLAVAVVVAALTPLPVSHAGADAQLSYLDPSLASSFVPAADALQCSLLDPGSGNGAHVRGQDGGWSYAHGGLVYWNYSDTFLNVADRRCRTAGIAVWRRPGGRDRLLPVDGV